MHKLLLLLWCTGLQAYAQETVLQTGACTATPTGLLRGQISQPRQDAAAWLQGRAASCNWLDGSMQPKLHAHTHACGGSRAATPHITKHSGQGATIE
jgi:hypothetical protein